MKERRGEREKRKGNRKRKQGDYRRGKVTKAWKREGRKSMRDDQQKVKR